MQYISEGGLQMLRWKNLKTISRLSQLHFYPKYNPNLAQPTMVEIQHGNMRWLSFERTKHFPR